MFLMSYCIVDHNRLGTVLTNCPRQFIVQDVLWSGTNSGPVFWSGTIFGPVFKKVINITTPTDFILVCLIQFQITDTLFIGN